MSQLKPLTHHQPLRTHELEAMNPLTPEDGPGAVRGVGSHTPINPSGVRVRCRERSSWARRARRERAREREREKEIQKERESDIQRETKRETYKKNRKRKREKESDRDT